MDFQTVNAQAQKAMGKSDYREVRYDLLHELRRKRSLPGVSPLVETVSEFISKYNVENARRREMKKPAPRNVTTEQFIAFTTLIEQYGASLVGALLCAYGSCREPREEDAPEGRGAAAGGETVAGKQAIFHRPASSGIYALICNLDLYRIGLNDITRQYVVDQAQRQARTKALVHALASTLLKPTGAQRNTQNPHIVACEGIIATSSTSLPAPTVSPLHDRYQDQIEQTAKELNKIKDGVTVKRFTTLAVCRHYCSSWPGEYRPWLSEYRMR